MILIQELRLRTRDADTLFASVSPRVNTYPMQFLLSYEAHVSSLSLLHFEDSIKAADQISDKEPEGVQNSSGAEYDTIVATPGLHAGDYHTSLSLSTEISPHQSPNRIPICALQEGNFLCLPIL